MASLTPFSTALLSVFITSRLALAVYWLNILLLGTALLGGVRYAERTGLVKEDTTAEIAAIKRSILTAQALYAFGASLCIISTAIILLVQLTYAIALRMRLRDSLLLRRRTNVEEQRTAGRGCVPGTQAAIVDGLGLKVQRCDRS